MNAIADSGSPFPSFFMGGFESSTAVLSDGRRLDVVAASQHDREFAADYDLLRDAGVMTVRESVRWPVVDRGGSLALNATRGMARSLRDRQMVPIWDLMHYGFPDDVDPYAASFIERFARYARAVAEVVTSEAGRGGWFTPINEISFMSHAAGDIGLFFPFSRGRGFDLKLQLVRAAVAAMHAIREVDPDARFLHVDPLIHLVPRTDEPAEVERVRDFNERIVFEAWQMLAGLTAPELGGQPDFLTVAGLNVYRLCQWEFEHEGSFLGLDDPRWTPIRQMLADASDRLGVPVVVAETGELGPARVGWLRYLLDEVEAARVAAVPVHGVCWYPIVSAPDWYDPTTLFAGGWWDLVPDGRRLVRVPHRPVLEIVEHERFKLGELDRSPTRAGAPVEEVDAPSGKELTVHDLRSPSVPESWKRLLLAAGENVSVASYVFAPGRAVGIREYVDSEIVLYVVEGEVTVFGWHDAQVLTQGAVAFIDKGRPFGVHNHGDTKATVLQVASPPPWNADLQGPETAQLIAASNRHRGSRPRDQDEDAGTASMLGRETV